MLKKWHLNKENELEEIIMGCFVAPVAEAIVTTVVMKVAQKKEKEAKEKGIIEANPNKISWSKKLSWLNKMLWGGSFLLAFEHIWHGEIVPWPPFFTAMQNPADIPPMLHEIATIGVGMMVLVTMIWVIMVVIADRKAIKAQKAETEALKGV